jgi:hypothetical protein
MQPKYMLRANNKVNSKVLAVQNKAEQLGNYGI